MRHIFYLFIFSLIAILPYTKAGHAHPHAYIDLRSGLIFDQDNRAVGLKVFWKFDPLYTAFVLNGIAKDEAGKFDPVFLKELAAENLKNLKEYDYFANVKAAGIDVPFDTVSEFETDVEGANLWLEYTIPFQIPLAAKQLAYSVYDPTYYIEILHTENTIHFGGSSYAEENCSFKPEPTEELISQMASLGREESAGDTVGQLFAEKVEVTCF